MREEKESSCFCLCERRVCVSGLLVSVSGDCGRHRQ